MDSNHSPNRKFKYAESEPLWNVAYLSGNISANNSLLQTIILLFWFFLKTDFNFLCKSYMVDVFITTIT
jgi:hypothetical protein